MPRRSSQSRKRLLSATAAFAWVLCCAVSAWGASRTIEMTITSLAEGSGEVRGKETCDVQEHEALVALKRAGDPALTDCMLDAWETNRTLKELGLNVREITTNITRDRYELNWRADFLRLPGSLGPVNGIKLESGGPRTEEYKFSATLSLPTRAGTASGVLPLGPFPLKFTVRFPGTVDRNVAGNGQIDHTGEAVSWKTEMASLRTKSESIGASVMPGRASEQRYWLILMVTLTVVVGVIMFGLLRRGAKNSTQTK